MPSVPAFCDTCGTVFNSGIFVENATNITFMRIPRHSATQSTVILPPIPRAFCRVSRSEATQELQVKVLG